MAMKKVRMPFGEDLTGLIYDGLDWIDQYSHPQGRQRIEWTINLNHAVIAAALHALWKKDVEAMSKINGVKNLSPIEYSDMKTWLTENHKFPEKLLERCMTLLAWMVVKKRLPIQPALVVALAEIDDKGIFVESVGAIVMEGWRLSSGDDENLTELNSPSKLAYLKEIHPVLELLVDLIDENDVRRNAPVQGTSSDLQKSKMPEKDNSKVTSDLPKSKVLQDTKDSTKDGPIHKAAAEGRLEAVLDLLDQGVDVNTKGDFGYTPLQYAAKYGRLDMVKCLVLQRGADLNLGNDYNWTPLHHAANYRRYEIAKFLVHAGADTQLVDTVYEMTPGEWAKGDFKMTNLLKNKGINK